MPARIPLQSKSPSKSTSVWNEVWAMPCPKSPLCASFWNASMTSRSRPKREEQKSFILPSSQPVQGLQKVQAALVRRTAKLYTQQGKTLSTATADQDTTIIETQAGLSAPLRRMSGLSTDGGGMGGSGLDPGRSLPGWECAGAAGAFA